MLSVSKALRVSATNVYDLTAARDAIRTLRESVKASCANLPKVPDTHSGKAYEDAAKDYAEKIGDIREEHVLAVFNAAKEITKLCKKEKEANKDWTLNKDIVNLWLNLAKFVVERFGERADDERVGAMIISKDGELKFFDANRIPDGIAKKAAYYGEQVRKTYGFCAEKNVLRQFLNVRLRPSRFRNTYRNRWDSLNVESQIDYLKKDIVSVGKRNKLMKDYFLVTTAPPCKSCQEMIAAVRPRGIIAAHRYLGFTRGKEMEKAEDFFNKQKRIRFISVRQIEPV